LPTAEQEKGNIKSVKNGGSHALVAVLNQLNILISVLGKVKTDADHIYWSRQRAGSRILQYHLQ
jgi:hypothetical protein